MMHCELFLIIAAMAIAACIGKSVAEDTNNQANLRAISTGVNEFSANLYKTIAASEDQNLICSPVSVAMVLSMAEFGAGGETEQQMRSVLHSPCNKEVTKKGYQALIDTLNNVKSVNLSVANKIYTRTGFRVKSEFKKITANNFRSEAQSLDFSQADAASKVINAWCEAQTNNRIKNIIKPDDLDQAVMILVNAVYFKGNWKKEFDPKMTTSKPFYTEDNSSTNVQMMQTTDKFNYGEIPDLDARFIQLPYKSTNDSDATSMIFIVPNSVDGMKNLEEQLDEIDIKQIRKLGTMTLVQLSCPKFKIESTLNLQPVLTAMGMSDMFSNSANFTGITDDVLLQISKVLQKAFVQVDEKGSEAAAVTVVGVRTLAVASPPTKPIIFNIDRQFTYAIIHDATNTVLFEGHVKLPSI